MRSGFTLVEIVVAMAIAVVIMAAAIPSYRGHQREKEAREPVAELAALVAEVRDRAMAENRPYQITFYPGGFVASRFLDPYVNNSDFRDYLIRLQTETLRRQVIARTDVALQGVAGRDDPAARDKAEREAREAERRRELAVLRQQQLEQMIARTGEEAEGGGTLPTVDVEGLYLRHFKLPKGMTYELLFWGDAEWDLIEQADLRKWVFQPSGLCHPLTIKLRKDEVRFEIEFSPLDGSVLSEKYVVP